MAASHLLLFLANSVRIFGQGICYDSNTTKGFNYWKGDPADQSFDLDLCGGNWKLSESDEFAGYSHERITMEVYLR